MADGIANIQTEQLQLSLLENALDFLLSAAESVHRDDSPRSLKDAVLHVANGVELLVKSRLAREHWTLIFSSIDKASQERLIKGDFVSVDFQNTLTRLEQIVGISIDDPFNTHLDDLRKVRNRLTHFTATLDPVQTRSLLAKSMNWFVDFCEQQDLVTPEVQSQFGEIHKNLTALQEFVDGRMERILDEWKDALIWECPECWRQALVIDAGEAHCKFCLHKTDPQELAASNTEIPVEDCPECDAESTFALVLYNNEEGEWVCFACGVSGEDYAPCMRCDRMENFPDQDEVHICESCWSDVMSRR